MTQTPDPTGLLLPSRVTLILAASVVMLGMTPCLGLLEWFGALLCVAPTALGIAGLQKVRKADPSLDLYPAPFLGTLVGGVLLLALSISRLILGGGLL